MRAQLAERLALVEGLPAKRGLRCLVLDRAQLEEAREFGDLELVGVVGVQGAEEGLQLAVRERLLAQLERRADDALELVEGNDA